MTKAKLLTRLAEYESYQADWDSYKAAAPNPVILAAARHFVVYLPDDLALPANAALCSGGSVQFEWCRGPKVLELEFETLDTLSYLRWHPDENVEEEGTFPASDVERIAGHVRWFMREDGKS